MALEKFQNWIEKYDLVVLFVFILFGIPILFGLIVLFVSLVL